MTFRDDIPSGLVGIHPRQGVGCHISMAVRNNRGTPDYKGRFFITTEQTHSETFETGHRYKTRTLHPSFVAWNNAAFGLGENVNSRKGPGRLGTLKGNLVHAKWQQAAFWNRAAQKLPHGHPNPPLSLKPACEGDGISALRFKAVEDGREAFERIACPNRECEFAMCGACKPSAHLIFRLRWDREDAAEAKFPSLLAHWNSRGWESMENMVGLLEMIVGTEALLPEVARKLAGETERAKWKAGMAAELGIKDVSLMGLPFAMTIGERTKPPDERNPQGYRYPVVNFSPDGDWLEWLLMQARTRRELAGSPAPQDALPPASVQDQDFLEIIRHEARVEIDPRITESESTDNGVQP